MEWVETTGRTVEDAKDAALDQLGVDEQDAEFEVLEEPKLGLFGRVRAEARVRARVRPTRPRPKEDRRDRRRRGKAGDRPPAGAGEAAGESAAVESPSDTPDDAHATASAAKRGGRRAGAERARPKAPLTDDEGVEMDHDVPLQEQAEVAQAFLQGLLEQLAAPAQVVIRPVDEDTIEVAVTGDDLGLLIGPKGATLTALQDLARTVVQRKTGARNGRLLLDISGYRQKRKVALERFTREVADQVKATGTRKVLEPMHPADRKIVHDTANSIDGVSTASEGEEPRRRVVILPD